MHKSAACQKQQQDAIFRFGPVGYRPPQRLREDGDQRSGAEQHADLRVGKPDMFKVNRRERTVHRRVHVDEEVVQKEDAKFTRHVYPSRTI